MTYTMSNDTLTPACALCAYCLFQGGCGTGRVCDGTLICVLLKGLDLSGQSRVFVYIIIGAWEHGTHGSYALVYGIH